MKKVFILVLVTVLFLNFLSSCRESITKPADDEIKDAKLTIVSLKEIQEPSQRVSWNTGESHSIKWEITQNLENVKILLLKKYVEVAIIEEITMNDGIYNWAIPNNLPPSHHYRIRLTPPNYRSASATSVEFEIMKSTNDPIIE